MRERRFAGMSPLQHLRLAILSDKEIYLTLRTVFFLHSKSQHQFQDAKNHRFQLGK